MVVTVAIVGSTLYYFDAVHRRELDHFEKLMVACKADGKSVVSCAPKLRMFRLHM